jgi:hypothetical protein
MPSFLKPFRRRIELSPYQACEIARRSCVLEERDIPNHGRIVPPEREELVRFLEERTEFLNYWLGWSENEQLAAAWYFRKVTAGYAVGRRGENEEVAESRTYRSIFEACADYILKELNELKE